MGNVRKQLRKARKKTGYLFGWPCYIDDKDAHGAFSDHGSDSDSDSNDDDGGGGGNRKNTFVEVDLLRPDLNARRKFPNNSVRTAKYTLWSGLPLSLLYQFHKVSNIYFLIVMVISLVPGASPINPFSSVAPLCIVLGAGIIKDLWEDWKRRKADTAANKMTAHILKDGVFAPVRSCAVQPGDVMLFRLGEEVKADCLIMSTSLPDGLTYIETANLDGETNAKTRRAKIQTVELMGTVEDVIDIALGGLRRGSGGGGGIVKKTDGDGCCCGGSGVGDVTSERPLLPTFDHLSDFDGGAGGGGAAGGVHPAAGERSGECAGYSSPAGSDPNSDNISSNAVGGDRQPRCQQQRWPEERNAGRADGTVEGSTTSPNDGEESGHARGPTTTTREEQEQQQGGGTPTTVASAILGAAGSGGGVYLHSHANSGSGVFAAYLHPHPHTNHHHYRHATLDERMEQEGSLPVPAHMRAMSRQYEEERLLLVSVESTGLLRSPGRTMGGTTTIAAAATTPPPPMGGGPGGASPTTTSQQGGEAAVPVMESSGVVILGSAPSPDLSSWYGQVRLTASGEMIPVGIDQFLPRGCIIRNTDWVLGAVVYTGRHTKMLLNLRPKPNKSTRMTRRLNEVNIFLFAINQVMMLILCGLAVWFTRKLRKQNPGSRSAWSHWYLEWNLHRYTDVELFFWRYLTNFILLSYLIPMSLYVTLEFNKAMQMLMIGADKRMAVYDEFSGKLKLARPKTSELNNQLGQVEYIFTDKTGTLTENLMTYVGGFAAGITHDEREKPGGLGRILYRRIAATTAAAGVSSRSSDVFEAVSGGEDVMGGGGGASAPMPSSTGPLPRMFIPRNNINPDYDQRLFQPRHQQQQQQDTDADTDDDDTNGARLQGLPTSGDSQLLSMPPGGDSNNTDADNASVRSNARVNAGLELDDLFRYLRAMSLCHNVVCFDVNANDSNHTNSGGGGASASASASVVVDGSNADSKGAKKADKGNKKKDGKKRRKKKEREKKKHANANAPPPPPPPPPLTAEEVETIHAELVSIGQDSTLYVRVPNAVPSGADRNNSVYHSRNNTPQTPGLLSVGQHSRVLSEGMTGAGRRHQEHMHGRTGSSGWYLNRYTANTNSNNIHQCSATGVSGGGGGGLEAFIDRSRLYEGQSLDEIALVAAARENGFTLFQRTAKQMFVKVLGGVVCYDIIAELDFTPQRKLMSILLQRNPTGDSEAAALAAAAGGGSAHYHRGRGDDDDNNDDDDEDANRRKKMSASGRGVDDGKGTNDDIGGGNNKAGAHTPITPPGVPLPSGLLRTRFEPFASSSSSVPLSAGLNNNDVISRPQLLDSLDADAQPLYRRNSRGGGATHTGNAPHHTHPYLLLVKGADSSMMDIVDNRNPRNATLKPVFLSQLDAMASQGLRTLVLGQRQLSEAQVRSWLPSYADAQCAMSQRSERLHAAYALIERDVDLVGTTAVEDKLQEGVPETLEFMSRAGIVVWMLTGDKRETAVTIALTSGLVDAKHEDLVRHIDLADLIAEETTRAAAATHTREDASRGSGGGRDGSGGSGVEPTATAAAAAATTPTATTESQRLHDNASRTRTASPAPTAVPVSSSGEESSNRGGGGGLRDPPNTNSTSGKGAVLSPLHVQKCALLEEQLAAAEQACIDAERAQLEEGDRNHHDDGYDDDGDGDATGTGTVAISKVVVLVVDGKTLDFIFQDNDRAHRFFLLGSRCRSAVCCRMTPLQKAQIVRMFQHNMKAVALAIGDGANDVSMIQESKIGVGIMGLEGSQAELASDYAIPKFRFLKRLLLVHGRFSIFRDAHCIVYSLYKNVVLTVGMVVYSCFSAYSGQAFIDSWLLAMFSIFFCSLQPLMIGIIDKDVEDELAETLPELYPPLARESMYFSFPYIIKWCLDGLVEGCFFFFFLICTAGMRDDLYRSKSGGIEDYGTTFFVMLVLVVDLRVGVLVCYYMILFVVAVLLEIALLPAITLLYSQLHDLAGSNWCVLTAHELYGNGRFYMFLFFAVGVMVIYSISFHLYIEMFYPWQNGGVATAAAERSPYRRLHRIERDALLVEYRERVATFVIAERAEIHRRKEAAAERAVERRRRFSRGDGWEEEEVGVEMAERYPHRKKNKKKKRSSSDDREASQGTAAPAPTAFELHSHGTTAGGGGDASPRRREETNPPLTRSTASPELRPAPHEPTSVLY